jgi:hypothetical protein
MLCIGKLSYRIENPKGNVFFTNWPLLQETNIWNIAGLIADWKYEYMKGWLASLLNSQEKQTFINIVKNNLCLNYNL